MNLYVQDNIAVIQERWKNIRNTRSLLLSEADKLVNIAEDAGRDATAIRQYRQKLRDVTTDFASPDTVVWPVKPE